jgi:hypothetical protein
VSGEWWAEEQVVERLQPGESRWLICAQVELVSRWDGLSSPRIIATFLDDEPRSVDELYKRRVYKWLYHFDRDHPRPRFDGGFGHDMTLQRVRTMLEALGHDAVRDPVAVQQACERGYLTGRAVKVTGMTLPYGRFPLTTAWDPLESTKHEVTLRRLLLISPCWPNQKRYIPDASWWLSLPRELAAAWEPVAQARALAMKSDAAAARWMRVAGLLEEASRSRAPAPPADLQARGPLMVAEGE